MPFMDTPPRMYAQAQRSGLRGSICPRSTRRHCLGMNVWRIVYLPALTQMSRSGEDSKRLFDSRREDAAKYSHECSFAAIPVALAQDFPVRPVRLVVANPPGSTADLVTRLFAKQFSERWKQPAVVDNRGGAAGLIGTDIVAKAVPDGYTVLVSAPGPLTTHMFLGEKLRSDPLNDLAPITLLAVAPSVLMVSLKVPAKSVAELIEYSEGQSRKVELRILRNRQSQSSALAVEPQEPVRHDAVDHSGNRGRDPALWPRLVPLWR